MKASRAARREDRVVIPNHVQFRRFEDELVILDLVGGEYFALNATGARMWERLASGDTPEETAAVLLAEYNVDPKSLLDDCLRLVDELVGRGLVKLLKGDP
jgi:hypothetical protein